MAAASDKARYYLELSVPELQECERTGLFNKNEISAIARKRSDFEHIINARGCTPADYVRYAEWEMNLEALRRKRVKRKRIKRAGFLGQRRIFFVLDRGTRKFHGDIALWMQYMEYARCEKAQRKLTQIMTNVLKLHPTKPDLWIYVARYHIEDQADMNGARNCMQRGLRFCKTSRSLWLEYARLEMIYLAKIWSRRKILGLDVDFAEASTKVTEDENDADIIHLPDNVEEDLNPYLESIEGMDDKNLRNLSSTPLLTGAIPMAVFDGAMAHFDNDPELAERFFDSLSEFDQFGQSRKILEHVAKFLTETHPSSISSTVCNFRLPILCVSVTSSEFPLQLNKSLQQLRMAIQQKPLQHLRLAQNGIQMLLPLLRIDELDEDIRRVVLASSKHLLMTLSETDGSADGLKALLKTLENNDRKEDIRVLDAVCKNLRLSYSKQDSRG